MVKPPQKVSWHVTILRAATVEAAIDQHPDAEGIPNRNIEVAREMGVDALKALREQCWFDDAGQRLDGGAGR